MPLPALVITADRLEDGVRWRYDGQQSFERAPAAGVPGELVANDTRDRARLTVREQVVGSIRVDEHGMRWIAVAADDDVLRAKFDAI